MKKGYRYGSVALIALGSNDVGDPRLERQLVALRARTRSGY